MEMEDKLEQMSERLEALKHEYHSDKKVVKVGAAVFTVLLVAFFGISLSQIKSKVDAAMRGTAVKESAKNAKVSEDNAKESEVKAKQNESNAEITATKINDLEVVAKETLKTFSQKYEIVEIYHHRSKTKPYQELFCAPDIPVGKDWTKDSKPIFIAFREKSK